MADRKDQVAASIVKARENLDQALAELERLPALDPSAVRPAVNRVGSTRGHPL